jgi:aspartyl-tRNA(Asn)/glutamyl-tRNA(Gln) amidotransferase subunit C
MDKIDKALIRHVADVSRLKLTEKEIEEFLPQLKEILDTFSEIQKVDTEGTKPSYHPVELKNRTREDIPWKPLSNEEALKNTTHKKDGYFMGPRIK